MDEQDPQDEIIGWVTPNAQAGEENYDRDRLLAERVALRFRIADVTAGRSKNGNDQLVVTAHIAGAPPDGAKRGAEVRDYVVHHGARYDALLACVAPEKVVEARKAGAEGAQEYLPLRRSDLLGREGWCTTRVDEWVSGERSGINNKITEYLPAGGKYTAGEPVDRARGPAAPPTPPGAATSRPAASAPSRPTAPPRPAAPTRPTTAATPDRPAAPPPPPADDEVPF